MTHWVEKLLLELEFAHSEREIFSKIEVAVSSLGFEFCAYGLRMPWPVSRPKVHMIDNYPESWRTRYKNARYADIDPTLRHRQCSQAPVVWGEAFFADAQQLWQEAQVHGLRYGLSQSTFDSRGASGTLAMARSDSPVTETELNQIKPKISLIVSATHLAMSRLLIPKLTIETERRLTEREVEVLKWTADGKTSGEISQILYISVDTVNFHVKNTVSKLEVANKTSAAVRAVTLGLLA
jgi:DNA-binding CsgD family transcriptional regulator